MAFKKAAERGTTKIQTTKFEYELCGISNDNIRLEKLMARVKDNFSAYMKNTTLLPRSLKNSFFPPPRRPLFLSRFCAHSRDQTTPFLLWRLKLIAR